MNHKLVGGFLLIAGIIALGALSGDGKPDAAKPLPVNPTPVNPPCPPNKPWGPRRDSVESKAPDGTEPDVDYPGEQWIRNIGSKKDGAGMCVFSSFEMMCRQAGLEEFRGFRDWCANTCPGGGYPEKLAKLVDAWCKHKNIPIPRYYQYEGSDLTFLKNSLKSGRFACVTLYYSARYGGRISHMVNAAHCSGPKYWAICDNNQMNKDTIPPVEWFDGEAAFQRAIGAQYWAVVLERPGLPCPPKN